MTTKLTIPAILVVTVMVAGMFAFMPFQQASTVHDTIIDSLGDINLGLTVFVTIDSIADVGNVADPSNDIFGATDDAVSAVDALAVQGRITITQAAFDTTDCDVRVTVTDVETGVALFADAIVIDGAALNDVGFFAFQTTEPVVSSHDISVDLDGADAADCDDAGVQLELRNKVIEN